MYQHNMEQFIEFQILNKYQISVNLTINKESVGTFDGQIEHAVAQSNQNQNITIKLIFSMTSRVIHCIYSLQHVGFLFP